jgi:hypothetical protein
MPDALLGYSCKIFQASFHQSGMAGTGIGGIRTGGIGGIGIPLTRPPTGIVVTIGEVTIHGGTVVLP